MQLLKRFRSAAGYTLIELLLVIGIFTVIVTFSTPVAVDFLSRSELSASLQHAKGALRRANELAHGGAADGAWGVRLQSGSITLFQGDNYASRNTQYDEVIHMATPITPTGVTEVVFQKGTGMPNTTGTLTLSSTAGTRTLTINSEGRVSE